MYEGMDASEQINLTLDREIDDAGLSRIREALSGLPGSDLTGTDGPLLTVEYFPVAVSRQMIVDAIGDAGYTERVTESHGPLQRRLERMARSSQATFGSGRLDCCNLNDPPSVE
jgi:hypothetical protein